jgi:ribonuclease HII
MCNDAIERDLLARCHKYICGIDEVGRGALFGPVVAGAVILNPGKPNTTMGIKDSKKLGPRKRLELSEYIYTNALAYSIGWCWNDEIDEVNILEATKKAMKMAVRGLQIEPDYVLMDGLKPDFIDIAGTGIIKGDDKSVSIAAAAIIAKVFRDELITAFSRFFPGYRFQDNKGYPTQKHIEAITVNGITAFHRKSFRMRMTYAKQKQ